MLRKILLITGILSVALVSVACLGADETTVPKPESYPTLLPLVMAIPTETYLPTYPRATPTATPWPTKVPKSEVVDVATATPEPVPTPTPTVTPIPDMEPTEIIRKVTPTPTINPSPTLTREKAIWMASHGLSLAQQNLEGVDLSNHSWGGVNFSYANLRGVNFTGANLRRANLRYADLTGADLTGADLGGAYLTGADMTETSSRDLSQLNWIERELVLTGQLPHIPNWLFPPITEDPFIANTEKGARVAQGQEMLGMGTRDWCELEPTRKQMLMDYAVWLGHNIDDWLARGALDRCPLEE